MRKIRQRCKAQSISLQTSKKEKSPEEMNRKTVRERARKDPQITRFWA